jgi:hypothetical protein
VRPSNARSVGCTRRSSVAPMPPTRPRMAASRVVDRRVGFDLPDGVGVSPDRRWVRRRSTG